MSIHKANRRFQHTPRVEIDWCEECRAHVTMPCVACIARLEMASGRLRRLRIRETPLRFQFEPEEQANYERFWQEHPHGLCVLGAAGPVAVGAEDNEQWWVRTDD